MFNYRLYDYEPFDYMGGVLPEGLAFGIDEQLARARKILSGRNNAEVAYGLESLGWLLEQGSKTLFDDVMTDGAESRVESRPIALMSFMPYFDLDDQAYLKSARHEEYFALLVMAAIAEGLYLYKYPQVDRLHPEFYGEAGSEITNSKAFECYLVEEIVEAISFAEGVAFGKSIGASSLKAIGKKGGTIRASKYADLKDKVVHLYESKYSEKSDRQGGKLIAQELTSEDMKVLTTPEPEVRFQAWIGEYRRSKGSD